MKLLILKERSMILMKRKKVKSSVDRKIYKRTAQKTAQANIPGRVSTRGGIRL